MPFVRRHTSRSSRGRAFAVRQHLRKQKLAVKQEKLKFERTRKLERMQFELEKERLAGEQKAAKEAARALHLQNKAAAVAVKAQKQLIRDNHLAAKANALQAKTAAREEKRAERNDRVTRRLHNEQVKMAVKAQKGEVKTKGFLHRIFGPTAQRTKERAAAAEERAGSRLASGLSKVTHPVRTAKEAAAARREKSILRHELKVQHKQNMSLSAPITVSRPSMPKPVNEGPSIPIEAR
jgi:hypothetical protein